MVKGPLKPYIRYTGFRVIIGVSRHRENLSSTYFVDEMTIWWLSECRILERWLATESSYREMGSHCNELYHEHDSREKYNR